MILGSDWPIAPFGPRPIMAAAQLRRPWNRPDRVPVAPSQALTAEQALAGYTLGRAQVVGAEHLGRVGAGCRADLTVWAADPVRVRPEELATLPIELTVVDGRIMHRADAPA